MANWSWNGTYVVWSGSTATWEGGEGPIEWGGEAAEWGGSPAEWGVTTPPGGAVGSAIGAYLWNAIASGFAPGAGGSTLIVEVRVGGIWVPATTEVRVGGVWVPAVIEALPP